MASSSSFYYSLSFLYKLKRRGRHYPIHSSFHYFSSPFFTLVFLSLPRLVFLFRFFHFFFFVIFLFFPSSHTAEGRGRLLSSSFHLPMPCFSSFYLHVFVFVTLSSPVRQRGEEDLLSPFHLFPFIVFFRIFLFFPFFSYTPISFFLFHFLFPFSYAKVKSAAFIFLFSSFP